MVAYGSKPFKEAIDYFNQKLPLPTTGWAEVYGQQHDHAFMVAGANKAAIVEGFAGAVQAAIEDGETLQDFRKRFDDIVAKQGWDYNGSRNWRSRLIYETNIRQAYNAGREAQMADPAFQRLFPFAEYRHSGAENYRPQHKAWDRLVLAIDDPWWQVHSPSNGYGCKCKKFPVSRRTMQRRNKSADTAPADDYKEFLDKRTGEVKRIPLGIDPGFEHRPGVSWLRNATLKPADLPRVKPIPTGPVAKPALPAPTPVPESMLMANGLADEVYVRAFMGEFGATGAQVFKDVQGSPIAINEQLFQTAQGAVAGLADKRAIRLLARTLIQPDEIWQRLEPDQARSGKYHIRRRYLARFKIGDVIQSAVFDVINGAWSARVVVEPVDTLRTGALLYSGLD